MIDFDPNRIKRVGFDLDRTLYVDDPRLDDLMMEGIYRNIAERLSMPYEEARVKFLDIRSQTNSSGLALKELGYSRDEAEKVVRASSDEADLSSVIAPNQTVLSALEELKARYGSLDLITGTDREIALHRLTLLGIKEPFRLFEATIFGDDSNPDNQQLSKQDGSAFREWMLLDPDLTPDQFLYVGDTLGDLEVPRKLGMCAIRIGQSERLDIPQIAKKLLEQ